jgi:hypothetical protein
MTRRLRICAAIVAAVAALVGVMVWRLALQAPRVALGGTVGRCTPVLAADRPRACAALARAPALLLSGPLDDAGNAAGKREIPADAARRFEVHVRTGRYALCLDVEGALVEPRGLAHCVIEVSRARTGLQVTPTPAWTFAGYVAPQ